MKVTAHATRSQGWWAVEVPEVDGAFTQARRLDQVPAMVRDAVALLEDVAEDSIEVEVVPEVDGQLAATLASAKDQRAESERLARAATEKIGAVARAFSEKGLPLRDIGVILGMSHQRVAQIIGEPSGVSDFRAADRWAVAEVRDVAVWKQDSISGGAFSCSGVSGRFERRRAAGRASSRTLSGSLSK